MKALIAELRIALIGTLALSILLCGLYPLLVWILAQLFFPHEANGSLVTRKGIVIGSSMLAQPIPKMQNIFIHGLPPQGRVMMLPIPAAVI